MTLDDEKEALATIFFECARYERPSTEWIAALDLFTAKVTAAERERAGRVCDDEARILQAEVGRANGLAAAWKLTHDAVLRRLEAAPQATAPKRITAQAAEEMGARGAKPTEAERLLFEAWMKGHCWKVQGTWSGEQYIHESETSGIPHAGAMNTRQLWAAWRDRAALAAPQAPAQPVGTVSETWAHWPERGNVPAVDWANDTPPLVGTKLYAVAAPQAPAPLTGEQMGKLYRQSALQDRIMVRGDWEQGVRDGEKAHGITGEAQG